VSPNYIDCTFAVASCDWILSEFLRLYLNKEQNEVLRVINSISKIHLPMVEEINGELVILNTKMTAKEQILVLLHQKYPVPVQRNDLKRWVKGKSTRQINRALSDVGRESLIYETQDGIILTSKGVAEAERILIKYSRI